MILPRYPGKIPQTSPFTPRLQKLLGTFQEYVGEVLDICGDIYASFQKEFMEKQSESQTGISYNGGFPQQPWVFPTKNDQDLGCEMGGTTIWGNTHMPYA